MNLKISIVALCTLMFLTSCAQSNLTENIVGYSVSIQSEIMNDQRVIQVFLPDGYESSDVKYPVVYILDGQRYFLHGVSLQKSFVEFNETSEFIVVGISKNTADRNRNYSINSEKYLDFIKKEVIGYVDKAFRTSDKRILFGWAYGGGFAIETMTKNPNLFDAYIAASPFPLDNTINMLDSLIKVNPNLNKLLYFTSGTREGVVREGTNKLETFLTNNDSGEMDWTFRELEGEEHRSTPFTTMYHGLKKCFEYYPELQFNSLDDFLKAGGLTYVYNYYQERASRFGFSKELPDWTMFSLTRNAIRASDYDEFDTLINEFQRSGFIERLSVSRSCLIAEFYLENKQYDKAINFFKVIAVEHPNAARPQNGLGNTYVELKDEKEAARYFEKAKELAGNK